jgi:hypothetical protein
MLVDGSMFNASTSYYNTDRRLQMHIGHIGRFIEFQPRSLPLKGIMASFLFKLYLHGLCCFLTGSFVYYIAGTYQAYAAAILFIAMDDTPLKNLLFQKTTTHYFTIDDFHLHLLDEHPAIDVVIYMLVKDDFSIPLFIFGIDSTHPCGPYSNVDFTYFVWQYFEMLSFRKCAMTLIPGDLFSRPRILYLTHNGVASDACNVRTRCRVCQHTFQEALRDLASCQVPAPCTCNLCVR